MPDPGAVVELDARLLGAGPAALDAALRDHAGQPRVLRVAGDWATAPPPEVLRRSLGGVVALTMAVGDVPETLRAAFDLVADGTGTAARIEAGFARAPHAALTAALLLRARADDVAAGLAAESATYSMLLASPEFATWRTAHPARPHAPDDVDTSRVRVEHHEVTTVISLTRPARHNALDPQMRDELHAALLEASVGTGPVVLRGDGPSFCSGGDLDTFGALPDPATGHIVRLTRSVAWLAHLLAERLVVGLHGACLGAGIEIPAFAAHVVAADDARVGLPELGLGLIPGAGGTVSMTRRSTPAAVLELLLTDGTIPADAARDLGWIDEVVPRAHLDARLLEIAESLA